jgi:polyhydroxybutyrate depolymerase
MPPLGRTLLLLLGLSALLCTCVSAQPAAARSSRSEIAAAGRTVAASPSPGCRSAAAPASEQTISYDAAGEQGLYVEDAPPRDQNHHPLPVVFDLHGYLETASLQNTISGLGTFGDSHGFVTISPQVTFSVQHWDVAPKSADITYLEDLLGQVERTTCVDEHRVFFAGYSNGAWMTSVMACELSKQIAAVATVAGLQDYSWCRLRRPVPVVAFHGTADPFVAYNGGSGHAALSMPAISASGQVTGKTIGQEFETESHVPLLGPLPQSIPVQVRGWARRNGCGTTTSDKRIAPDVTLLAYSCPSSASVDFYQIAGGGHAWPGSTVSASLASVIGRTTLSINADQVMWSFFQAHPLRD